MDEKNKGGSIQLFKVRVFLQMTWEKKLGIETLWKERYVTSPVIKNV
jgi:hypothetical protein